MPISRTGSIDADQRLSFAGRQLHAGRSVFLQYDWGPAGRVASASVLTQWAPKFTRFRERGARSRWAYLSRREMHSHFPFDERRSPTYGRSRGIKPSVSVCMKLTIASSSSSARPGRPALLVLMFGVDSGAGQQVVPSPGSWGWQRGSVSRVL